MLKSKKIITVIVISLFLFLAIPFVIDWLIIGNNIPSNISNSDWVSFLGGYIGAIVGCAISFLGIIWTIKFTREQNRLDRELQIRPYFDIRYVDKDNFYHTNSWLGYVEVHTWEGERDGSQSVGDGMLFLKNIGSGPATNINFRVSIESISTQYEAYFINQNTKVTTNSIMAGEKAELTTSIRNNNMAPKNEEIIWDEETGFCRYDITKFKIPERFSFSIIIEYSDLLGNRFEQKLLFDARYSLSFKKGEDSKYNCSLYLEEIGAPHKTNTNN